MSSQVRRAYEYFLPLVGKNIHNPSPLQFHLRQFYRKKFTLPLRDRLSELECSKDEDRESKLYDCRLYCSMALWDFKEKKPGHYLQAIEAPDFVHPAAAACRKKILDSGHARELHASSDVVEEAVVVMAATQPQLPPLQSLLPPQ
jgi:hypothetical protein